MRPPDRRLARTTQVHGREEEILTDRRRTAMRVEVTVRHENARTRIEVFSVEGRGLGLRKMRDEWGEERVYIRPPAVSHFLVGSNIPGGVSLPSRVRFLFCFISTIRWPNQLCRSVRVRSQEQDQSKVVLIEENSGLNDHVF